MLACNSTAANIWRQADWPLNQNPASTVYRVLWAAAEPVAFAYTGSFINVCYFLFKYNSYT